jgi:membrane protein YqaA with SNARE-associated domain
MHEQQFNRSSSHSDLMSSSFTECSVTTGQSSASLFGFAVGSETAMEGLSAVTTVSSTASAAAELTLRTSAQELQELLILRDANVLHRLVGWAKVQQHKRDRWKTMYKKAVAQTLVDKEIAIGRVRASSSSSSLSTLMSQSASSSAILTASSASSSSASSSSSSSLSASPSASWHINQPSSSVLNHHRPVAPNGNGNLNRNRSRPQSASSRSSKNNSSNSHHSRSQRNLKHKIDGLYDKNNTQNCFNYNNNNNNNNKNDNDNKNAEWNNDNLENIYRVHDTKMNINNGNNNNNISSHIIGSNTVQTVSSLKGNALQKTH